MPTTALLAVVSLFVGVSDVTPWGLVSGAGDDATMVLAVARIPRTVALLIAGSALAVCGLLMQMLVRNRFVEPTTTGTAESATLGLLVVTVFAPGMPLIGKMGVAALFALAGTGLFLLVLSRIPLRDAVIVPLVGLMLGGVIGSVVTFFAYRLDLLQTLGAWTTGDFSGVLRGRYELLWLAAGAMVLVWFAADRFAIAGLGREMATSLGLDYRRVMAVGTSVVALVTAVVIVTAGIVPFLGLVVPNLVSAMVGDHLRRSIPLVAATGAAFVLACDVLGRVVRHPYEIPLGVVVGVAGAAIFLVLLLREARRG